MTKPDEVKNFDSFVDSLQSAVENASESQGLQVEFTPAGAHRGRSKAAGGGKATGGGRSAPAGADTTTQARVQASDLVGVSRLGFGLITGAVGVSPVDEEDLTEFSKALADVINKQDDSKWLKWVAEHMPELILAGIVANITTEKVTEYNLLKASESGRQIIPPPNEAE